MLEICFHFLAGTRKIFWLAPERFDFIKLVILLQNAIVEAIQNYLQNNPKMIKNFTKRLKQNLKIVAMPIKHFWILFHLGHKLIFQ